jgi:hypothetical protein
VRGLVSQIIFDPQKWIPSTATISGGLALENLKLYPNPATNQITLYALYPENIKSVYICDLSGRKVKVLDNKFSAKQKQINLDGLRPGVYIMVVEATGFYQPSLAAGDSI